MNTNKRKTGRPKDSALDTPSEANTGKHINFLEQEEKALDAPEDKKSNPEDEQRKKKWKEGIEAGKRKKEGH